MQPLAPFDGRQRHFVELPALSARVQLRGTSGIHMTLRSMPAARRSLVFLRFARLWPSRRSRAGDQRPTAQRPLHRSGRSAGDDTGEEEEIVVVGAGRAVRWSATSRRRTRSMRATCGRPARPTSTSCWTRSRPQIGSAQGRGGERPVLLLNGQRISSFRELRDIPTEAIQRVEILPEEVALKYGYRADQKVVNIVLRQRFRSTVAQVGGGAATDGGYASGNGDVTPADDPAQRADAVQPSRRGQLDADRGGAQHPSRPSRRPGDREALAARSLVGTKRDVRGSATFNRQVSATFRRR